MSADTAALNRANLQYNFHSHKISMKNRSAN
jgi:hypothetical protein